jgi:hypothetical protein
MRFLIVRNSSVLGSLESGDLDDITITLICHYFERQPWPWLQLQILARWFASDIREDPGNFCDNVSIDSAVTAKGRFYCDSVTVFQQTFRRKKLQLLTVFKTFFIFINLPVFEKSVRELSWRFRCLFGCDDFYSVINNDWVCWQWNNWKILVFFCLIIGTDRKTGCFNLTRR